MLYWKYQTITNANISILFELHQEPKPLIGLTKDTIFFGLRQQNMDWNQSLIKPGQFGLVKKRPSYVTAVPERQNIHEHINGCPLTNSNT